MIRVKEYARALRRELSKDTGGVLEKGLGVFVLLLLLKLAEVQPLARWSWWVVAVPLGIEACFYLVVCSTTICVWLLDDRRAARAALENDR